jgi:menaquinone-dependent protoporphyrinogen oxidase
MRVLIAVASRHGSTMAMANRLQERFHSAGHLVELTRMDESPDPAPFDTVIIGSAIYMGNWLAEARDYVRRYNGVLNAGNVWMFSSGPLGDPVLTPVDDPKRLPELLELPEVRDHRIFAGSLDPVKLGIGERIVTRLVKAPHGDFRDWDAIDAWADNIMHASQVEVTDRIEPANR